MPKSQKINRKPVEPAKSFKFVVRIEGFIAKRHNPSAEDIQFAVEDGLEANGISGLVEVK